MSCNDKNCQQLQLKKRTKQLSNINDLQQILVLVYMPNHWGLIFVDLAHNNMYFADGLQSAAPTMSLTSIKWSLEFLCEMYPYHPSLQTKFWKNYPRFQHFGMPSQAPGIGVIMATRDFINNFQWRYCDMDQHWKTLMLQILDWSIP